VQFCRHTRILDTLAACSQPDSESSALGINHLEGIVCKRVDSPYRPGRRSGDWVKVKHHQTAEVVIGG
ncbi:ATP-dependent DNA ligase, partial [Nonomuraea sp. NPDC003754]